MGSTIQMTCCSSEEKLPDDNNFKIPTYYTAPYIEDSFNLPRCTSQTTTICLEDKKE